jgi:hypothetical protein
MTEPSHTLTETQGEFHSDSRIAKLPSSFPARAVGFTVVRKMAAEHVSSAIHSGSG